MTVNKEMVMEALFLDIEREIAKAKNKEILYEDIKRILGAVVFDYQDFEDYDDYVSAERMQYCGVAKRIDELNDYLINSRGIRVHSTKYVKNGKTSQQNHYSLKECKKGSWYDWR